MGDAKIAINGVEYSVPTADTFDLDEAEILWTYSQRTVPELVLESGRIFEPGVLKAVLHIAVRRADPTADVEQIRKAVGAVNVYSFIESLAALAEEDDAGPPVSPPPSDESGTSLGSSRRDSGSGSTPSSAVLANGRRLTGGPQSAMSATSVLERSAV